MIKILIVDDHTVVREGLKGIISETTDMVVADEASTGQKVLEEVRKKNTTWLYWISPCPTEVDK